MTIGVVDWFKAIKIKHRHKSAALYGFGVLGQCGEVFVKAAAIGKAGQRVRIGNFDGGDFGRFGQLTGFFKLGARINDHGERSEIFTQHVNHQAGERGEHRC